MYKVVWITKFRKGEDRNEMRRRWLDVHGPLVLAAPGLVRYVQNHWEETNPWSGAEGDDEVAFDGHAEAWFESEKAFLAAMATPQFQAAIEDVPKNFDPITLVSGVLTEYVMKWEAFADGRPFKTAGPRSSGLAVSPWNVRPALAAGGCEGVSDSKEVGR